MRPLLLLENLEQVFRCPATPYRFGVLSQLDFSLGALWFSCISPPTSAVRPSNPARREGLITRLEQMG